MDQIFNELSASCCYVDTYSANAGMESLINISIELSRIGFSTKLRTVESFHQLLLSPQYTIQSWVTDRKIGANRDLQRWLLTAATQAPYVENLLAEKQFDKLLEFKYKEDLCYGFGLAYLSGCGALSLNGDPRFTQPEVEISLLEIDENCDEKNSITISSIYSAAQLKDIKTALAKKKIGGIKNGDLLLQQMPKIFPNLKVGDKAEGQIQSLNGSEQYFSDILQHLEVLNRTMAEWNGGRFDPQGIEWSPESESTLNQFSEYRTFCCKDNETRIFSSHSKIRGANQRIHFYPITEQKLVHIGYVGKHLPTNKHRT
jgi:hypothetical protein